MQSNSPRFKEREHPRCELRLDTRLELEDGRQVHFHTSNISQSGFAGHTIETAAIGSEVELHLPNIGPLAGKVIWQVGTAIGARLDSALTMDEIMSVTLDSVTANGSGADDLVDGAPPVA
jgi:hypothetical protein